MQRTSVVSPISPSNVSKSMSVEEGDTATYEVKRFCDEGKIACSNITTSGKTIVITLVSGAQVFLSFEKNIKQQLSSLQLTLNQLTIEGKQFKKLDFRFDKITVSF